MGGRQLIAAQFDHDDGFFTSGQSAYFYGKYKLVNWDMENIREVFFQHLTRLSIYVNDAPQ